MCISTQSLVDTHKLSYVHTHTNTNMHAHLHKLGCKVIIIKGFLNNLICIYDENKNFKSYTQTHRLTNPPEDK